MKNKSRLFWYYWIDISKKWEIFFSNCVAFALLKVRNVYFPTKKVSKFMVRLKLNFHSWHKTPQPVVPYVFHMTLVSIIPPMNESLWNQFHSERKGLPRVIPRWIPRQHVLKRYVLRNQPNYRSKVLSVLEACFDLISSPSLRWKFKSWAGKLLKIWRFQILHK